MFKVLVIAYYFPPMGMSGIQRPFKFVQYMKKYNWEPTVITTGDPSYYAIDEQLAKELKDSDVRVIRTEPSSNNGNGAYKKSRRLSREFYRKCINRLGQTFFIPDTKITWAKRAFDLVEDLLKKEKFNAVYIIGPPFSSVHIFSKLKHKYNLPLVIDYGDLWSESYFAFYPTPLNKYLNKKMEYNALKSADKIIAANRKIKENLLNKYQFLTFKDVVIITNGFDPEEFKNVTVWPKHNERMRLTYSGIFQIYNTPKYFLKAFKEISIEHPEIAKNIELHFIGFLRKENENLIEKLNLREFVFNHGFVSHHDAAARLRNSDVFWMMVNNRKRIESVVPGKIYEYIGAKKPIIGFVPDGAAKIILEEYPASYICKPDDINEIKKTILQVYEDYRNDNFPKVDDEFLTNLRRDYLTEQLVKEFQFLVKAVVR
ncbi:MAG: glycosyltransferase family 4 protein [Ignavibacteria bacterium]|jgi:hypothetical protein